MKFIARKYLAYYGDNFKALRAKTGLSQTEVARELKISQSVISHIECGVMLPPSALEEKLLALYELHGGIENG